MPLLYLSLGVDEKLIYLVGMGPGNIKNLTLEVVEILENADKIISFGRIGDVAESFNKNIIKVKSLMEIENLVDKEEILNKVNCDENIAILASGDPCFYGILEYLKRKEIAIDRVVPGVSSIQYMMAKLQKSWHGANLVSFHGREEEREEKILKILEEPMSIILTDSKNNPSFISQLLYERGVRGKIYVGYNLSYEDENIITADVGDDINEESTLAVVLVDKQID